MTRTAFGIVTVRFWFRDESNSLSQTTFYRSVSSSLDDVSAAATSLGERLQSLSGASLVQIDIGYRDARLPPPDAPSNEPIYRCGDFIFDLGGDIYANVTVPAIRDELTRTSSGATPGAIIPIDQPTVQAFIFALVDGPWRSPFNNPLGGDIRAAVSIRPAISLIRTIPI